MMEYRDRGAVGALLDEYEKAVNELKVLIQTRTFEEITEIVDSQTSDPDCRSIQTILSHVVASGHAYVHYMKMHLGESSQRPIKTLLPSIQAYVLALDMMFRDCEELFDKHPEIKLEEFLEDNKILVRWGQRYDFEQLMEHAIVHILRHRRQIERFILKMNKTLNK